PAVFVESGLPALFRACYARGARKERLVVRIAGAGTSADIERDHFEIGRRNLLIARQLFWKNGILVSGQDVGGTVSRTLSLHVGSGTVMVRTADGGSTYLRGTMAINVLLIDDSAVMRAMILKSLEMSGVPLGEVFQAANGEEGL